MYTTHRPPGITIIAVLVAITGLVTLVGALAALFLRQDLAAGLYTLLVTLVIFYLAWGLWTLRRWAWLSVLITEGAYGLLALLTLFGNPSAVGSGITLVLAAIVIWYLLRPDVRGAFRRPAGE